MPDLKLRGHRVAVVLLAAVGLGALAGPVVAAGPAAARPVAEVTISPAHPAAGRSATLHLSGRDFQSVKNGFGGIYVLFGVVRGTWQPSRSGASGLNYLYVGDSEQKDNHGYQRFVAFPGDSTGYAANGGTLAADGTWHTDLVLPGSTFVASGRSGRPVHVDCLREQCGVITVGAHGVVNPHNETFTPVSFTVGAARRAADVEHASRPHASTAHRTPSRPTSSSPTRTTPAPTTPAMAASAAGSTPATSMPATSIPATSIPATSPVSSAAVSPAAERSATRHDDGSSVGPVVGLAVVATIIVLGGGGYLWQRRRTRA